MLTVSYALAAAAMFGAALYLILRLRLFLTTTTMLIGSLLLIYGPASLSYTLYSGEFAGLIRHLSGAATQPNPLWAVIKGKVPDLDAVVIAMNFSITLMYVGVIAGVEIVDQLIPNRIATLRGSLTDWSGQALWDDVGASRILGGVMLALALFMLLISFNENHIATIKEFLSASPTDGARNAVRLKYGGSTNYLYRVLLGAVAPMFIIWGALAAWVNRSWWLFASALLLFLAVLTGKFDTLSKAPPIFFLAQLAVATLLIFSNRITWRTALPAACLFSVALYLFTRLIIGSSSGTATLEFMYSRIFEAESETLLENFAAFPFVYPHMWGANLHAVAMLMGRHYIPGYSIVAQTWHGTFDVTSPSLFIADAWIDFSYAGVVVASLMAGAICRLIDAIFLVRGKTAVGTAVLGATFIGVFTLLTTALNTALLSGGLLLAPLLAGLMVAANRYSANDRRRDQSGSPL